MKQFFFGGGMKVGTGEKIKSQVIGDVLSFDPKGQE